MKKLFFTARYAVLAVVLFLGSCLTAAAQFSVASPTCMAHTVAPTITTTNFSYTLLTGQVFSRWGAIGGISIPNTVGTVAGAVRTIAVTSTGFGRGRLTIYLTSSGCSTESAISLDINKSFAQATAPVTFTGPACVLPGVAYGYIVSQPIVSTAAQIAAGLADTYTWDYPAGATIVTSGDGSAALITMPGAFTTKKFVRVTIGACNAPNAANNFREIQLTVQPLKPSLTLASGIATCKADLAPFTLSYSAEAGVNYTWSIPNGWTIAYSTGNTGTGLVSSYTTAGTPTVTITPTTATFGDIGVTASYPTGGCGTSTATPFAVTRQLTTANVITSSVAGCLTAGNNVTFTVNPGFPLGTVYKWTLPTGWAATTNSTNSITVPVGTTSGDVTVQVVPNPTTAPTVVCNNAPPAKLTVTVSGTTVVPAGGGATIACTYTLTDLGFGLYRTLRDTPNPAVLDCLPEQFFYTITGPGPTFTPITSSPPNNTTAPLNNASPNFQSLVAVPLGSIVTVVGTKSSNCLRMTKIITTTVSYIPRGVANPGNGGSSVSALTEQTVVYPNPAGNLLQVNLPVKQAGTSRLTLTDALGRVVLTRTTEEARATLDVRGLPEGSYTLRTTVPGGKEQAQAVQVQH